MMDPQTRLYFVAHVRELERRAIGGDQDAVKSLACMALLTGDPPDDPGDGEVVDFTPYLTRLVA